MLRDHAVMDNSKAEILTLPLEIRWIIHDFAFENRVIHLRTKKFPVKLPQPIPSIGQRGYRLQPDVRLYSSVCLRISQFDYFTDECEIEEVQRRAKCGKLYRTDWSRSATLGLKGWLSTCHQA